ncbi:MAG: hypothetical protein OXL37_10390 [Chloroflexota bacterium]|nr:hypothetical protein [Chloroflexota bacterium]MDE2959739.1 hypothetical protein [Chloroflexota bacterium]
MTVNDLVALAKGSHLTLTIMEHKFVSCQGEVVGGQGLFKVPDGGLSPRTVIPAEAGIQQVAGFGMFWIPAFAGMTVRVEGMGPAFAGMTD